MNNLTKGTDGERVGRVLRIERSSIHDGTGLRTVVFLKGCPLRCLWCSTPESQNPLPEKGYAEERCTLCGLCVENCPQGALSFDEAGKNVLTDREKCVNCFKCVKICPSGAMKSYGAFMTVNDVVREVEKDAVFYFHSGGGVTISGGEPLDQPEFVQALLRECQKHGIHRALETSFFAPWETIEPLLPLVNLLFVDMKHSMPKDHHRLTGVDNSLILENIIKADASEYDFNLIIRTPLIPGINDSEEALTEAAVFLKGLEKLEEVEFLAYHRLGTDTYAHLGIPYPLNEIKSPSRDFMLSKARFFMSKAQGIPVVINGVPVNP